MNIFSFSDLCVAINKTTTKIAQVFTASRNIRGINLIMLPGEISESELEKQREATLELLDEILPKIKNQVKICRDIDDKYSNWIADSADYRAKFLKKIEKMDSEKSDIAARVDALGKRLDSLREDERKCQDIIAQKSRELNEKRKSLETWCWVPGYNIYLLADYESSLNSYKGELDRKRKEISAIQNEYNEKVNELSDNKRKNENLKELLKLFNSQSEHLNDRLNISKGMVYEWNQAYDFFIKLKSDLETIEDFEVLLNDAEQHLAEAAEKESMIDYNVLKMNQIYMGDYHIRSFDGKWLAMSKDSGMIVTNNVDDKRSEFSLVTLTNGATIIMDVDFYVAHYNEKSQIHFQSVCAFEEFVVKEESFYITLYGDNSNLYRVGSSKENDALCLDICASNYNEGTQVLMWPSHGGNNQRFILEKID